jgi:hypothetical protein
MALQAFAPFTFQGSSVALTTGTTVFTEVESVSWTGLTRTAVETTHLTSTGGAKTFIAGDIIDYGEVEVDQKYSTQLQHGTLLVTTAKCDTLTLTFKKAAVSCGATLPATAASIVFSVVFVSSTPTWPKDGLAMMKHKFKVSGAPTFVEASTP